MSKRKTNDCIPTVDENVTKETAKKTKTLKEKVPKTVLDKIISAIRSLKSPSGSSAQAIQKVCSVLYGLDNSNSIKKALKNGVAQNVLLKNKQSFLVFGDPIYEDTSEKVEIEDIKLGDDVNGEGSVDVGTTCVISYKGTLKSNNYQFDASKTFTFQVGQGEVIKGMDAGVIGMKLNGRRKVTIPSSLGYGKRGSSPDIPPDATLCFDIVLKSMN